MVEEQVIRTEEPEKHAAGRKGSPCRSADRKFDGDACGLVARLVASHCDVALGEIVGRPCRSRRVTRARHLAMYLAHVVCGLNLAAVGAGFNRDRTTASYACNKVEDARDDPAFDAALADLEISTGVLFELQCEEGRT